MGDTLGETESDEATPQVPIEVNLTAPPPSHSEVEVGGEGFKVRVNSASSLGEAVAAAERLWKLRSGAERPGSGFSLPSAERRGTWDTPAGANPVQLSHQEPR